MALTEEFRQMIEENIHEIILTIPTLKKEYPKLKKDWKFEHDFDFLYGIIIGQILGSSLTAFKIVHQRKAATDEMLMIAEIVESYFSLIRDEIIQS